MQTFLPYPDYVKSAEVLDYRRLGKQRVECLQILNALSNPAYGWQNHPAVRMWRDYFFSLSVYGIIICQEWKFRGYKDTCLEKIRQMSKMTKGSIFLPPWITEEFCASHRSNLLRKDPVYYSQFNWPEPDNLPYIWPV